jgi:hypothetical protein
MSRQKEERDRAYWAQLPNKKEIVDNLKKEDLTLTSLDRLINRGIQNMMETEMLAAARRENVDTQHNPRRAVRSSSHSGNHG